MEIINYAKIKDTIKKYYNGVSLNLERAGWIEAFEYTYAVGERSKDIVKKYHQAAGNPDDTSYIYRRRILGDCGLPILLIYVKMDGSSLQSKP